MLVLILKIFCIMELIYVNKLLIEKVVDSVNNVMRKSETKRRDLRVKTRELIMQNKA